MPTKPKKSKPLSIEQWKEIASALYHDSLFAIEFLKGRDGSGMLIDRKTGKMRHWKERFADNMERIPGVKVDREAMHACSLPRKERTKWFKARNSDPTAA